MTTAVLIGIGSNMDPLAHVQAAAQLLRKRWPAITFSAVYRTAAREITEQDDFLNAVALVHIETSAKDIFDDLKQIELKLGKSTTYRFGPRTIDIDLLLFGNMVIDSPALTLPHPRMHERRFVLEPLCELIFPQEKHPSLGRSWGDLLAQTLDQRSEKEMGLVL